MINEILNLLRERDLAFIKQFCNEGAYMGEHGETIIGVCRTTTAEEVLNFMHSHDGLLVQALKKLGE